MKITITIPNQNVEKQQTNRWLVGGLIGALVAACIPYTMASKPRSEIRELPIPPRHYQAPPRRSEIPSPQPVPEKSPIHLHAA